MRVLVGVRRKRILMALEACKGYLLGSPASRGMGKGLADALREKQNPNHSMLLRCEDHRQRSHGERDALGAQDRGATQDSANLP